MRNRAKCKLCQSVIESFLPDEIVYCACGEIAVCDGPAMRCVFNDVSNFLRVDDIGNEIKVSYVDKAKESPQNEAHDHPKEPLSKAELIDDLYRFAKDVKELPIHDATSVDLADCILAIVNILRRED